MGYVRRYTDKLVDILTVNVDPLPIDPQSKRYEQGTLILEKQASKGTAAAQKPINVGGNFTHIMWIGNARNEPQILSYWDGYEGRLELIVNETIYIPALYPFMQVQVPDGIRKIQIGWAEGGTLAFFPRLLLWSSQINIGMGKEFITHGIYAGGVDPEERAIQSTNTGALHVAEQGTPTVTIGGQPIEVNTDPFRTSDLTERWGQQSNTGTQTNLTLITPTGGGNVDIFNISGFAEGSTWTRFEYFWATSTTKWYGFCSRASYFTCNFYMPLKGQGSNPFKVSVYQNGTASGWRTIAQGINV